MKSDVAHALLNKLTGDFLKEDFPATSKYFQAMAKYKYDGYKQFSPGMRFIERLALWLKQFNIQDREIALQFVKEKLVYVSGPELDLLIASCFPDTIRPILVKKISKTENIDEYKINEILTSQTYRAILRKSLFCGLSDGSRTEIFRRSNPGVISHEQVYQTYELSDKRAKKMQEKLAEDLVKILGKPPTIEEQKFTHLFLLDDFSASGTSYLKWSSSEDRLKGKINAVYESIFQKEEMKKIFDVDNLDVHIILYLCTDQAYNLITENFEKLVKKYDLKSPPQLHVLHRIPDEYKLQEPDAANILSICDKDDYYDKEELEDEHTAGSVKRGFSDCSLPLVLYHNCPNNSVSILWAYELENIKFEGLFPRIPRHKQM